MLETLYWAGYYNTDILDTDRIVKHSFAFILLQWRKEVAEFFIELIWRYYAMDHMQWFVRQTHILKATTLP